MIVGEVAVGGPDEGYDTIHVAGPILVPDNTERIKYYGPIVSVVANDSDNHITRLDQTDAIFGVTIAAKGGADYIEGDANGNDRLFGGDGNDVLYGEAGDDRFVFTQGAGADFEDGTDLVDLRFYAGTTLANTTLVAQGAIRSLLSLAVKAYWSSESTQPRSPPQRCCWVSLDRGEGDMPARSCSCASLKAESGHPIVFRESIAEDRKITHLC